ncbi:hypothetical protein DL96DRAFT_524160 [Flagelloscypha sp. PMI_526]|nr:hypothetical protein DL96DRAFT_524160 [Flagelloscypha sp. PMI_526]
MTSLLKYPPEIPLSIFGWCNLSSVYALRRTCKTLYDLTHDKIVWITHLTRVCLELDTPLAQFNLDAMSASEIEARVTSIFKLAYSLRTSASHNVLMHTPLSTRSIKGPPGTTWRAVSCCPGGRWMAAVVGANFQIWDMDFISRPPTPIVSLNVKNLEGNDQVWIQWYFSSRNYHLLVVYLRTSRIIDARQIVFDLRVDDDRTPLLTFRRQLRTAGTTFLHLDKANPAGPLLAANLYDKQLRFWYLETGEQLPAEEFSTLPGCHVCIPCSLENPLTFYLLDLLLPWLYPSVWR